MEKQWYSFNMWGRLAYEPSLPDSHFEKVLAARHPFADHYPFDDQEIRDILAEAEKLRATPVTTRKDIVRIPPALRTGIQVVSIALAWDDPAAIDALLDKALVAKA